MAVQGVPLLSTGPEHDTPAPHARGGLTIKTYVVLQSTFSRDPRRPNVRVVDVKLTQAAAQGVVNNLPGSWWVRKVANKNSTIS